MTSIETESRIHSQRSIFLSSRRSNAYFVACAMDIINARLTNYEAED